MSTKRLLAAGLAACTVVTVQLALSGSAPEPRIHAVTPIPSPAAAAAAQPQLSVSPRGVLLSWIERTGATATLRFAERTGTGWTGARDVASGDDWFINWADVPSVVRLDDGTLVGHWLQKSGPDTYAYDVRLAYSRDDGRSWSASFTPHHDGTKTEHGFASLFQMPGAGAGLGLVWLDGRATKSGGHEDGHGGGGAMSVRFASFDSSFTQLSEVPVDRRVCECCPTAAAVTSEGVIAAFRNRSDEEVRDIYVSRLAGGRWSEPAAVHADGWTIPACPVNGPALSARGRAVAIAWFTVKNDEGQAYVAFSSDAGRTFGVPVRVDDHGSLGRVDVELLDDGSAAATWIEFANGRAEVRLRRVDRTGTRSPGVIVAGVAGSRASGYPRMARHGQELVLAWTDVADGGALRVRTAAASLP